jgi:uncharacterized membrane protein YdjX (TVP38/TMEM64 family)
LIHILSWGFLGVFIFSSLLYLIPFIGPSTMVLSGAIAAIFPSNPPILVGTAVAAGASVAKAAMYYLSYFAGRKFGAERVDKLHRYCERMGRWKSLVVFLAAATPIPDEPVLVGLALVRYSPLRVFLAFFLGKLVITVPGAYLGKAAGLGLSGHFGDLYGTAISVIFTIVTAVVLLKVDLDKIWMKWVQRREHKGASSELSSGV